MEVDVRRGQLLFKKLCAQCHTARPTGRGSTRGPNLFGVVGAPSGSLVFAWGGSYQRLQAYGLVWSEATLLSFLENPRDLISSVRGDMSCMNFKGMDRESDRVDLVAFLKLLV
mmetsp:Transcript_11059/g.25988  ORF Transcript_11059/g.25988 Transcript_11059/m.25988 type:complete len:113 (-) Transcript_11059:59-397(-)|eukprot:CAMPEP_0171095260 /NCGR_PEP_ID=MMETSP0766_2-20121228/43077_1 /TAXON_ID=439317 /ORGANISM="Gambierdiscus australes, Strain CAWD 149" /LENGTH=112 /DNA_ID=CAMNT_0011554051 /DNA_START=43 /DNA_END=381 /DNA_ORIENTATION=+